MQTLVRAKRVIDGTGAEPIEKGAILVSGNIIEEVNQQSELRAGDGIEILDAGNRTVIPGLIDCHAHLCPGYRIWTYDKYVPQEITKSVLRGVSNAERCVRSGVLTARDAGCAHTGIFQMRCAINSGQIRGPRLHAAGPPITTTGGHDWNQGREVDGPHEARSAARDLLGHWNADCLKFAVTSVFASYDLQMTPDELAAGVEEARKRSKRTLAHCGSSEGAIMCVKACVDSIEHGYLLDNAALSAMKEAGTFYVPTLYWSWVVATKGKEVGLSGTFPVEQVKETLDSHREAFQKAYRMGVNIATGTDLGFEEVERLPFGRLGDGLISEMKLMIEYGMTPLDAIKAATCMSARNLGIENSVGTLEKGKLADLVIVDGNPLEEVDDLRRVWRVMKEGQIVFGL